MKLSMANNGIPTLLCAMFASGAASTVALAQQPAVPYQYKGTRYLVSPNNSKVLRTEAAALEATAAVCDKDNPCRYDDLPELGAFAAQGSRWTGGRVTYSFVNSSQDIPSLSERGIIGQAFGLWTNVSGVYPSEVANGDACTANIKILWGAGEHGDGFPFDGPGGILAHAFFPPPNGGCIAGDTHFDEGETWVTPGWGRTGIDLATVAAHELGHALGLNHSADPNALMYAFYSGRRAYLSHDDIAGIRSIYGGNPNDVIFQIETIAAPPPGRGSFRLREGSAQIKFRRKGTATYVVYNRPAANSDAGGSVADVDGVLARGRFTTQFDGFWWRVGDLFRSRLTLSDIITDIDQIQVVLTITDNILTAPERLAVSINGRKLGEVVVNPGRTTLTATYPINLVNTPGNGGDTAALHYGTARY